MRNPHNTNQTLYYLPTYKRFPVQTSQGPLVKEYLERLRGVFGDGLNSHSRLFVVRIDLRYSRGHSLPPDAFTNAPIQRFLASLKAKLDHKDCKQHKANGRVNRHDMRYAWAFEIGKRSGAPHYHLVLLLNGDAYRSIGNYGDYQAPGLYRRILEAWASAIGIPIDSAEGLASVPKGGAWLLNRSDREVYSRAFYACSYLCKVATKPFSTGQHCFGSSRRYYL